MRSCRCSSGRHNSPSCLKNAAHLFPITEGTFTLNPRASGKKILMGNIRERNILLREQVELPVGLKLSTRVFREGWEFANLVDARRLERKLHLRGWNFIGSSECRLRSGVGDTSQEAIANALRMALRQVSEESNAVGIDHVELTQYPWFFMARVRVSPYRIQQSSILPVLQVAGIVQGVPRRRRLPSNSAALFPHFGCSMPMLKELLIASNGAQSVAHPRSFN